MSQFLSLLEPRTLFSALPITKATLAADKAAIVADAAMVKADLNLFIKNNTIETAVIAKEFKPLPKGDQTLLRTLESDELKSKALFLKEVAALNTPSVALAGKSESVGLSLLTKANVKLLATASKDITALGSVTTLSLAALDAHLDSEVVNDDRAAILTALPDDAALDAEVTLKQTDATAGKAAIGTAATQLANDIVNLASDLTAVHTATGTFPSIVGTFTGTAHETAGKNKGQSAAATLTITSEDANGNLQATVTNFLGGVDPLVGTVSLNGVVALKATPGTGTAKLAGVLTGTTLAGSFTFASGKGTFSVTEVTG